MGEYLCDFWEEVYNLKKNSKSIRRRKIDGFVYKTKLEIYYDKKYCKINR